MGEPSNQELKLAFLKQIAVETAKLSYPGAMSRQPISRQIVIGGTKRALETYFKEDFPILELWDKKLKDFDCWHKKIVKEISKSVTKEYMGNEKNNPDVISAKFLNTFMHQLMKYEKFRYLYKNLHLPLDKKVLEVLSRDRCGKVPESLKELAKEYRDCAYSISHEVYMNFQNQLSELFKLYEKELPELQSRIELNCILWID